MQFCFNAGTLSTTLAQHLVSVAVLGLLLMTDALPSKHETLTQCCFIVGHLSYTVLAGWYCCASEAGQSTEGQSVLIRSRVTVTSPNRAHALSTWLTLYRRYELMGHLYQCSSDQLSQNLKIRLRGAVKKVIPNTHMELDMFPILQI